MTILDRLPYYEKPSFLNFGPHTVRLRGNQIVVWVSLPRRASLDRRRIGGGRRDGVGEFRAEPLLQRSDPPLEAIGQRRGTILGLGGRCDPEKSREQANRESW